MATAKAPQHNSSREKLAQAYHLAGEAASETAGSLRERAASSINMSKQRATEIEKQAEATIKAHPVLSVGCAFLAGWAISKLLK